jgi:hypothetical protein
VGRLQTKRLSWLRLCACVLALGLLPIGHPAGQVATAAQVIQAPPASSAGSVGAAQNATVDLCALLPTGAGIEHTRYTFPDYYSCDAAYEFIDGKQDPNRKFNSIYVAKFASASDARYELYEWTTSYGLKQNTGTPATAYGDPEYAFDYPSQNGSAHRTLFARGCYAVDAGVAAEIAPGPMRAILAGVDAKLQQAPYSTACGAGTSDPAPTGTATSTATSTATETGTATATASATIRPVFDAKVDRIEVVQVIQDVNNSIPLVAGKKTMVRVFPFIGIPAGAPNRDQAYYVTASLTFQPKGGKEIKLTPFSGAALAKAFEMGDRDRIDSSVNFVIASELATAGAFTLKATINPDREYSESNFDNNEAELTREFVPRNGLRVGYVRMGYKPPVANQDRWPTDRVTTHDTLLRKIIPAPDAGIQYYELPWRARTTRDLTGFFAGGNLLIDLLEFHARMEKDRPDIIMAWVPDNYASKIDFGGLAILNDHAALGIDYVASNFPKGTFAHEIGHALGLDHTGTTGDPNPPCKVSSTSFFYWPAEYQNSAAIREVGFDTVNMEVVPKSYYDMMSYCNFDQAWISPFHYKKLFDGNFRPSGDVIAKIERVFRARGWAGPSGSATTFELVRQPGGNAGGPGTERGLGRGLLPGVFNSLLSLPGQRGYTPALQEGTGSYCMRFLGASDTLLYERCFEPMVVPSEGAESDPASAEGGFVLQLPDPGNVERVVLVRNEGGQTTELRTLEVSSNAPTLSITSPKAGDRWEGEHTIEWAGSDADGDKLRYDIEYSADGKASWYPMAVALQESSYTFSTDEILPSEQTYIRVVASDGYNTTHADVGPLVVPQQANSPQPPPPPPAGSEIESGAESGSGTESSPGGATSSPGSPADSGLWFIIGGGAVLVVGAGLGALVAMRAGRRRAVAQAAPPPYQVPPYTNVPQYPPQQYPPAPYPPQQVPPYQGYAPMPAQPVPRRGSKVPLILLLLVLLLVGGLSLGFFALGWRLPSFSNNSAPTNAGVTQPTAIPSNTPIAAIEPTPLPEITPTILPASPTAVAAGSDARSFRFSLEDIPVDEPVISDVIEGTDGLQMHLRLQANLYEDPSGDGVSRQPVNIDIALEDADEHNSVSLWLGTSQAMVDEFRKLLDSVGMSSISIELAEVGKSYEVVSPEGWVLKVTVNSMSLDDNAKLTDGSPSPYPVFTGLDLGVELIPK